MIVPGYLRRFIRLSIIPLMSIGALSGTFNAGAQQVPVPSTYSVAMTLDVNGEQSAPRVMAKAGEKFAVASGQWKLEMTVQQTKQSDDVWLTGTVFKGTDIVSAPKLLAHLNQKATIKVGDAATPFTLSMIVSPQP
jgi:bla regulator protein blaR1